MTLFLLLAAGVCLGVAALAGTRREAPGAMYLIVVLLAMAEWNAAYAMEIAVPGLTAKVAWAKAQYAGIATAPVALFAFAAHYSGRGARLTPIRLALLFAVPAAAVGLAWTNEAHETIWSQVGPGSAAGHPLALGHGPAYFVLWAYCYAIMLAATAMLIDGAGTARRTFRHQRTAMMLALATPWAANLAYVMGVVPRGVDLTTFAFSFAAVALAVACIRLRLLDVSPVARDALVEHMRDGMLVCDASGRVIDCNPAMAPLLRCTPDEAIGRAAGDVLSVPAHLLPAPGAAAVVLETTDSGRRRRFEAQAVRLPGRAARAMRLLLFHDVTERERVEARLAEQAMTDDLTHIGNRRHFVGRLEEARTRCADSGTALAILFVDLDDFKAVNDGFGHQAGDAVLRDTAGRLRECVGPDGSVARLGGDEFAVLLAGIADEEAAGAVARRVDASLRTPFAVAGRLHSVAASVGMHVCRPTGDECPEAILSAADQGMYVVKRAGRD